MKQILLILVLLISIGTVFSQTPTPTPPSTGQPSAEDIKQAKETVKTLLADKPAATPQNEKSIADVMDKGLDMLTGYVGTLEGVVSKYAPEVWRVMIRQQYAKAISYPLYWGLLLLAIIIIQKVVKSWLGVNKDTHIFKMTEVEERENTRYNMPVSFLLRVWLAGIFPIVVAIPVTIAFLYSLTGGVMILINPEYYALKDIIQLLK